MIVDFGVNLLIM